MEAFLILAAWINEALDSFREMRKLRKIHGLYSVELGCGERKKSHFSSAVLFGGPQREKEAMA